jgi:membrane AbrB-like protein
MLLSAIAHLLDVVHGAPPPAVVATAQLLIGASVGCRFRGVDVLRALVAMAASLGLVVLMLGLTVLFALALHGLTGLPLDQLVLAYVPGGIAEMGLIALSVDADPTFVATHHLVRVSLAVALAPALYGLYLRVLRLPT